MVVLYVIRVIAITVKKMCRNRIDAILLCKRGNSELKSLKHAWFLILILKREQAGFSFNITL